ncbi:MAG: four helix bundle protein [Prevotella sp.]|nr:four helix bundle protein [Prevotella sp.]
MASKSFTDIVAWQKSHEFVVKVYSVCKKFPEWERFGLVSQFTRAAVSIPANIAEGYRRLSKQEKLRFLNIAQGSLEECRYYIILAKDLNYVSDSDYTELEIMIEDSSRLLNAYSRGIENFSAVHQ